MSWEISLGGFVVGLLIGLTGMGGGLVMTPMMIFLFGVNPTVAVGTDLLYASVTKLFGGWQHWRQKTVDWPVVRMLSVGSVPGALAGAFTIMFLQGNYAAEVEGIVGKMLGFTYLVIALVMIWRMFNKPRVRSAEEGPPVPDRRKMMFLGLFGGFIVGLTSVGSGTLFMAMLVIIYPIAVARLVGTDIVQAVLVTGVAGIAHFAIGNVNLPMVGMLLIGSIPGILIGSRMTVKVPAVAVQTCLFLMIFLSGFKMLLK
ncbi:sulfite exporter TauE/SafE family protein [Tumebacillus sp. DT12]|uniref:Probable membrane transporter protein n=1 Tax=Tumebacillus lacus TaxID=2995335 RepID=A0ABT3WXR6_9BACL|nr:sulfite exporter TauE/SafE family protein [Tumebacillus lacus]MCX7569454.1 sulfite exporter TauE/SafE family protein [Tumebacillus lacus]